MTREDKSDVLAVQTANGNLSIWGITKQPGSRAPRSIRQVTWPITDHVSPIWIAWSKDGNVLRYREGVVMVWDVRKKLVRGKQIQTGDAVRGITAHDRTSTFYTLGLNGAVRQYYATNSEAPGNRDEWCSRRC